MAMQQYEIFFKRFGIKNTTQLMTPIINTLERFDFPRNAIHHFVAFDNIHYGPAGDDYIYRDVVKQIVMEHVIELTEFKGNPKKLGVQTLPYIREYHMKNRRFRHIPGCASTSRDDSTLIIANYGFVLKLYRYMRTIFTEYNKWWNIQKTLWDNVARICQENDREHFIFTDIPQVLPSVQSLLLYSKEMTNKGTTLFNTNESLFLLEVWKWLSAEHREESIFSSLSKKDLNKVNIVFQDSGKWILINLGLLNSWRYVGADEKSDDDPAQKVKLDPVSLQKRFLRMIMTLLDAKNQVEDILPEDEHIPIQDVKNLVIDGDVATIGHDKELELQVEKDLKEEQVTTVNNVEDTDSVVHHEKKLLDNLDDDLKTLEVIENKLKVPDEQKTNVVKTFTDKTINLEELGVQSKPEDKIISLCDNLAEDGLISAGEYKTMVAQSKNYLTIKSPYSDKETLAEHAIIKPEDIEIKESASIEDIPTVLDKTMLKSSLIDFDEHYTKKILPKDVSSMIVNIQNAGVIINNYEVDQVADIMGDYQIHTLKLKPVRGSPSTVRFKLPVVDEDGVFTANGNRYKMRKQRGD